MKKTKIAIVDPASSGKLYAEKASAMGYETVAIMTKEHFPKEIAKFFTPSPFTSYFHHHNFADTISFVKQAEIKGILPGGHTAMNYVDTIAAGANLVGNAVATYKARINKAQMKAQLKANNIRCANYIETNNLSYAKEWITANGFPVVMKPPQGLGGLEVHLCHNFIDVENYFYKILNLHEIYNDDHQQVLIEEYIAGDEFFITTLNHSPYAHKLLSIGKYEKLIINSSPNIYKNIMSQSLETEIAKEMFTYACAVNKALGVNFGINDIEFKRTQEGFVIIELNNRLPGANVPHLIQLCTGYNLYEENINIFTDHYLGHDDEVLHYKKHYCICCIINTKSGILHSIKNLEQVHTLPSFESVSLMPKVGEHVERTVDFLTAGGFVHLVNADMALLQADAEKVHQLIQLDIR